MRRREQMALASRHRPPRSTQAHLETRIQTLQQALRDVTDAPTLMEAQTIADEALSTL